MAVFFGMIVIGLFMWGILRAASGGAGNVGGGRSYNWLTTRGTPARGILLQVESYGLPIEGLRAFGIERRNVTIDVEIPGRPPYTATASVYVQRNLTRDVLP